MIIINSQPAKRLWRTQLGQRIVSKTASPNEPTFGAKIRRVADRLDHHIGTRLARRRKELAISARDLARSLDMHEEQILAYESGKRHIEPTILYSLAQKLLIPIGYFYASEVKEGRRNSESIPASTIDPFDAERKGNTSGNNEDIAMALTMLNDLFENVPSESLKAAIVEFARKRDMKNLPKQSKGRGRRVRNNDHKSQ